MVAPHLTRAALAAEAAAHKPPAPPRFPCKVTVRTESGCTFVYDGLFAHTFDAYDDAMTRFGDCTRVIVKAQPIQHLKRAAA